jgi:spoIIIJ-associated protein
VTDDLTKTDAPSDETLSSEAVQDAGSATSAEETNTVDAAGADDAADSGETPTASQLEDEGDIAADYIEELLDIADLDGDIDIDTRGGRAYISVSAGEGSTNLRILSKPDTVTALQELTRIAVQTKTGAFSRLILDVGGSRDARADELATLVDKAIARIEEGAEAASLPPMSSYERKLVHDIVSERGFVSESEGEGRDRHTVISRAK